MLMSLCRLEAGMRSRCPHCSRALVWSSLSYFNFWRCVSCHVTVRGTEPLNRLLVSRYDRYSVSVTSCGWFNSRDPRT